MVNEHWSRACTGDMGSILASDTNEELRRAYKALDPRCKKR